MEEIKGFSLSDIQINKFFKYVNKYIKNERYRYAGGGFIRELYYLDAIAEAITQKIESS